MKIDEGKFKIFEQNNKNQSQTIKTQPNNHVKKTNNDTKKTSNNITNNNPNINKSKNDNKNKTSIAKTKNDNNSQENIKFKEKLIIKNEFYDIYINNLYNFLIKWTLGTYLDYSSSKSTELFSLSKKEKEQDDKSKKLILHMNILDIIFVLNKNLNDINFTSKLLDDLEQLINLEENAYCILSIRYNF